MHLADEPASNGPDGFPFLFGDTREMTVDPVVPLCGKVGRPFAHRVAWHEAGHCVCGVLLEMSVEGCSIEFIDGHFGATWSNSADLEPATSVENICSALKPADGWRAAFRT